jgi:hypothetical protein
MATEADKVNTGALATILTVGALAMIGISTAVTALVRYELETEGTTKGGGANLRTVEELDRNQRAELSKEASVVSDAQRRRYNIPIERAMQVMLQDLQRDPNTATAPPLLPDAGAASADAAASAAEADAGALGDDTPSGELTENKQGGAQRDPNAADQLPIAPADKAQEKPRVPDNVPAPPAGQPAPPAPSPAPPENGP